MTDVVEPIKVQVHAISISDADAALQSVEVVEPVTQNLVAENFTKEGGNILFKDIGAERRIEINLLLARTGATPDVHCSRFRGRSSRHSARVAVRFDAASTGY